MDIPVKQRKYHSYLFLLSMVTFLYIDSKTFKVHRQMYLKPLHTILGRDVFYFLRP